MAVIFIECGTSMASPFNTGIQRVVRSIVRESEAVGLALGHQCVPVRLVDSHFYVIEAPHLPKPNLPVPTRTRLVAFIITADRLFQRVLYQKIYQKIRRVVAPHIRRLRRHSVQRPLEITVQDRLRKDQNMEFQQPVSTIPPLLLLLDSTWDMRMWNAVDEFRAAGGRVCAVLYDLIPFTHPDTVEEHTRRAHTSWWEEAPLHVDSVICISQAVRDQFLIWQEASRLARRIPPAQVTYFYLGSELRTDDGGDYQLPAMFAQNDPYFLVVGSIEPRKNHEVILDAFEILWQEGAAVNLVIVGGNGWKSEAFLNRVKAHSLFKKRLFLLRYTTDTELALLYSKTAALVIASIAEGFGLPIVEASQRGTKVICSDIPVFREIAGDHATFFDMASPEALASRVRERIDSMERDLSPQQKVNPSWLTWRESAEQLFARMLACTISSTEKQ